MSQPLLVNLRSFLHHRVLSFFSLSCSCLLQWPASLHPGPPFTTKDLTRKIWRKSQEMMQSESQVGWISGVLLWDTWLSNSRRLSPLLKIEYQSSWAGSFLFTTVWGGMRKQLNLVPQFSAIARSYPVDYIFAVHTSWRVLLRFLLALLCNRMYIPSSSPRNAWLSRHLLPKKHRWVCCNQCRARFVYPRHPSQSWSWFPRHLQANIRDQALFRLQLVLIISQSTQVAFKCYIWTRIGASSLV